MTITRVSTTPAGVDVDPVTFAVIAYTSDLPIDLATLRVPSGTFFGPSAVAAGVIQAGWEGSITLSNGDLDIEIRLRPIGGWTPFRNHLYPGPPAPQSAWPNATNAIAAVEIDDVTASNLLQDFEAAQFITSHRRGALAIEVASPLPNARTGVPYDFEVRAISNAATGAFAWVLTGALPAGLAFTSDTSGRARISGTPTAGPGDFTFALQVDDGSAVVSANFLQLAVAGIVLVSQLPADGATGWSPTAPIALRWRAYGGTLNPASVTLAMFSGGVTNGVAQPGWQYTSALSSGGAVLDVTLIPTAGWLPGTSYGVGNPPYTDELLFAFVRMAAPEAGIFWNVYTFVDFATAAAMASEDVPGGPGRDLVLDSSARVLASTGATNRRDRVSNVVRVATGVYRMELQADRRRSLAEFHVTIGVVIASLPRMVVLSPESTSEVLIFRSFDSAGSPADANFWIGVTDL